MRNLSFKVLKFVYSLPSTPVSFSLFASLFLPHKPRSRSLTHLLQALPRAARGSHPSRHLHRPGPLRRSSPVNFWHWWKADIAHALSLSVSPCTSSSIPVFGMLIYPFPRRYYDQYLPKWTESGSDSLKTVGSRLGGPWNSRHIQERISRTLCRPRRERLFW